MQRLTRSRAWIGVLGVLLVGIVAVNVLSLSYTATGGKLAARSEALSLENAELRAELTKKLVRPADRGRRDRQRPARARAARHHATYTAGDQFAKVAARRIEQGLVTSGAAPPAPVEPGRARGAGRARRARRPGRRDDRRRRSRPRPRRWRPSRRSVMRSIEQRVGLLFAVFLLVFSVVLVRAVWLQGVRGGELSAEARSQQTETVLVPGVRGKILDRGGRQLAVSEEAATIFATPYQIDDPRGGRGPRSPRCWTLPRTRSSRRSRTASSGFAYVARKVDLATAERVRKLKIEGIATAPRQPPHLSRRASSPRR